MFLLRSSTAGGGAGIVARAAALVLAAGLLAGACARRLPPGPVAPDAPVQDDLVNAPAFEFRGCSLTPLARFHVVARVLSTRRYWLGRETALAPVDLALGWGPMSDSDVLKKISITQMGRYYMWSTHDPPIELEEISANSANMHLIPATPEVRARIGRVRAGDVVEFSGALVSVRGADGWSWTSSTSRDDTGDGACEVVFAESLVVR